MFEQLNDLINPYKEEVDNFDMKYIVNNFIKKGVKLENVPRWGNQRLTYGFK